METLCGITPDGYTIPCYKHLQYGNTPCYNINITKVLISLQNILCYNRTPANLIENIQCYNKWIRFSSKLLLSISRDTPANLIKNIQCYNKWIRFSSKLLLSISRVCY